MTAPCFKAGIIDLVKSDPYLVELDKQMDFVNSSYEMSTDWVEKKYQQIRAKEWLSSSDKQTLSWLQKKNVQLLNIYTKTMLDLTNKLADHMSSKGLLPKTFSKNHHYIGITTNREVYITSTITQERKRNCY